MNLVRQGWSFYLKIFLFSFYAWSFVFNRYFLLKNNFFLQKDLFLKICN